MDNPKVTKKGDQLLTSYVDEKTGRIAVYEVGLKLDVSDYSGQWFPAKVVEVDKDDREVLVHFENWSTRFDEWIKMDSNRLRPSPSTNVVKTQFKVGEQVEALWNTDGQKYSGVIMSVLPNDYYQVLFDDGIKLKKKYNQIFKVKTGTRQNSTASEGSTSTTSGTTKLPDLTPITQLASAAETSQIQASKAVPQPPPPLQPRPGTKVHRDSPIPKSKTSNVSAGKNVKKSLKRKLTSPPPEPLLLPDIAETLTPESTTPLDAISGGSDEPLSSKRKRTIQDYSALLKIRRRFPYDKETKTQPKVSRTSRKGRNNSPASEPPELFPESILPTVNETVEEEPEPDIEVSLSGEESPPVPEKSQEIESVDKLLPQDENDIGDCVIDTSQQPIESGKREHRIPSRHSKFRRRFGTKRRVKRKQSIKYVVVDDDEFLASRKIANEKKPEVSPTVEPTEHGDGVFQPEVDDPGTRIIKRRRRRTYAHSQVDVGTPENADTSSRQNSSSRDEPLSKRKRTIHDYSMLLKTRPKFFFDIDEEQKRANVLTSTRKKKDDFPLSESLTDSNSVSTLSTNESIRSPVSEKDVPVDSPRIEPKLELPVTLDVGLTSIATHRPIRRSSSQFARQSRQISEEIPVPASKGNNMSIHPSTKDGIKVKSESSGRSRKGSGSSKSRHRVNSETIEPPKEISPKVGKTLLVDQPLLGSVLPQYNFDETEELPDIGYYSPDCPPPPAVKINDVLLSPPHSLPSTKLTTSQTSPIPSPRPAKEKEQSKRRTSRLHSRWWKKRASKSASTATPTNEDDIPLVRPKPGRKRKTTPVLRNRSGDLLSGLTLKRIRKIRTSLYRQGFRKKLLAEPALRDVSVDIISCICGSTDEHGLMVQCEYCQCWQHGQCFEIETEGEMPKNYVCEACLFPDNARTNFRQETPYEFYKAGRLPRFAFGPHMQRNTVKLLQETNNLVERLYQVREIIYTSRIHMNVMEAKPDHPKLYQWDKPHKTISESNQERKFNKTYRPLLRRLLYFNQHDPSYVDKLRAKVETVVKWRTLDEKQKEDQRLNEKFGLFPNIRKKPFCPKSSREVSLRKSIVKMSPSFNRNLESQRLETESLRIREELEVLNRQSSTTSVPSMPTNSSKLPACPKTESSDAVRVVMESMLSKLEVPSANKRASKERNSVIHIGPVPNKVEVKVREETSAFIEEDDDVPKFTYVRHEDCSPPSPTVIISNLNANNSIAREQALHPPVQHVSLSESEGKAEDTSDSNAEKLPVTLRTPLSKGSASSADQLLKSPESEQTTKPSSSSVVQLAAVDFLKFDPSDPRCSSIVEDLVKSCIEEPESLIKTLEDLAKESEIQSVTTDIKHLEPTPNLTELPGTGDLEATESDVDLLTFLEDAMKFEPTPSSSAVDTKSSATSAESTTIRNGPFIVPKAPPTPPKLTLQRLTPELCRGNLVLTVLDQQRVIDQHLDEIDAKVTAIEKARGWSAGDKTVMKQQVLALQHKVQNILKEFQLLKSIGRTAEQGLREVIRQNNRNSESDNEQEVIDFEATDSADEGEDDVYLSLAEEEDDE